MVSGPVSALLKTRGSLTGQYLTGKRRIPVPSMRREPKGMLTVRGARSTISRTVMSTFRSAAWWR